MSKDDAIVVEGFITDTLPGGKFMIRLEGEGFEGHEVKAGISGKMRMNNIKIVLGDRVKVNMSEYNLEEGRITYRFRDKRGGGAPTRPLTQTAA